MAVRYKYWLIGGFVCSNGIKDVRNDIERPNLTRIPELLKYQRDIEDNVYFFTNSVGCCICIFEYGNFNSINDMLNAYDGDDRRYQRAYDHCIRTIKTKYKADIKDLDWVMPVVEKIDTLIYENHVRLRSIDYLLGNSNEYEYKAVMMLDASMIYQCTMYFGDYFSRRIEQKGLSKTRTYQISYYLHELINFKYLEYYLTNSSEIKFMQEFYSKWKLERQIELVIAMGKQSMEIYSFISNNTISLINRVTGLIMSILSTALLYEPVYEFIIFFIKGYDDLIRKGVKLVVVCYVIIACCIIGETIIKGLIEEIEYRQKIKKSQ